MLSNSLAVNTCEDKKRRKSVPALKWYVEKFDIKGTVMQIEKAMINDCLSVSKVPWEFRIPTVYNFAVIYPWNLVFS